MVSTFWSTGGWLADLTFSCEEGGVMTGTCYCRKWTSKHKGGEVPSTLLTDTSTTTKIDLPLNKSQHNNEWYHGKIVPSFLYQCNCTIFAFSNIIYLYIYILYLYIYLHTYRLYPYFSRAEYHWQYNPAGAHISI